MIEYKTKNVCSKKIFIELNNNKIKSVKFISGCDGNLKGISQLVKDLNIKDAIQRLEGIRCGNKSTSCPDQLAQALKSIIENT